MVGGVVGSSSLCFWQGLAKQAVADHRPCCRGRSCHKQTETWDNEYFSTFRPFFRSVIKGALSAIKFQAPGVSFVPIASGWGEMGY